METVGKFKEDLISTLGEAMDAIGEFANVYDTLSHIQDKVSKMFEEVNNVDVAMAQLDKSSVISTFEIELNDYIKNLIRSKYHTEPIKLIVSLVSSKRNVSDVDIEIADMIFVMEDGNFMKVEG